MNNTTYSIFVVSKEFNANIVCMIQGQDHSIRTALRTKLTEIQYWNKTDQEPHI